LPHLLDKMRSHCYFCICLKDTCVSGYVVVAVQLVMEAEQSNPEYSFLFDLTSPEHIYYRCATAVLDAASSCTTYHVGTLCAVIVFVVHNCRLGYSIDMSPPPICAVLCSGHPHFTSPSQVACILPG
jgi:hypothetical protein